MAWRILREGGRYIDGDRERNRYRYGDRNSDDFRRAVRMVREGVEEMCRIADEMSDEYGERRY